jgi:hypothetical protein
MPVLTSSNIHFGKTKKGKLELHKKSKLDGPYIIHRALVKIPSDLICIIESIRDMSVDISCRKRPGAEEGLRMPMILQLLLACLFTHPPFSRVSSIQFFGQLGLQR